MDVYRPVPPQESSIKYPAILGWSPYGKEGGAGNQVLDDFPFRMGVPLSKLSEFQKWEGPDPGYWVQFGYAIVAPDPRGVGKSEGNIYQFGTQEGRDGADVIDWVGSQEWCNGRVATSGNSWLSIAQWFIAAERPKHLACISPWEGFSDHFGQMMWLGGVVSQQTTAFVQELLAVNMGENSWENTVAMAMKHPDWNAYHLDKRARIENIEVPAYVVASYGNPLHTYGTFHTWARLASNKWLRVHDSWEWPDYYSDASLADLHRFFDHFLKLIDNGWTTTPRVRIKILDTRQTQPLQGLSLESTSYPLPEAVPTKYFLDPGNGSINTYYPAPSKIHYTAIHSGTLFTHEFTTDTILAGPVTLNLSISLNGATDSDVFVTLEKIQANGSVGFQCMIPLEQWYKAKLLETAHRFGLAPGAIFYSGPVGRIRLSRRVLDETVSKPGFPIQRLDVSHPVEQGQVVTAVPPMTPIGMVFYKGEKLKLRIGGQDSVQIPALDKLGPAPPNIPNINEKAQVTIHGGQPNGSGSYIVLPVMRTVRSLLPPKP